MQTQLAPRGKCQLLPPAKVQYGRLVINTPTTCNTDQPAIVDRNGLIIIGPTALLDCGGISTTTGSSVDRKPVAANSNILFTGGKNLRTQISARRRALHCNTPGKNGLVAHRGQ